MTASRDVSLVRSTLRIAPILAALAVLTVARPAVASDGAAAAEVLFAEGKRFVQDGNYAAACPKFEESQKLDPGRRHALSARGLLRACRAQRERVGRLSGGGRCIEGNRAAGSVRRRDEARRGSRTDAVEADDPGDRAQR